METDRQLSSLLALAPYTGTLGITLRAASKDEVRAVLAWEERLTTTGGGLHGGAIMSLADTAGAICAFLNLPPGANTTTIESKTNFFRPARSGEVEAAARPLHVGRRIIVVQSDLYGEDGKRIAQTTQTQAVLEGNRAQELRDLQTYGAAQREALGRGDEPVDETVHRVLSRPDPE